MNLDTIREAAILIGHQEPISIEPDGTVWLGTEADRTYPPMDPIIAKAEQLKAEKIARRESARAKLAALGLDADEVSALFGI